MFMVFAAPVYDKRIKFLVRDVSLSILNIYNRSAPTCKSRGAALLTHACVKAFSQDGFKGTNNVHISRFLQGKGAFQQFEN